MSENIKQSKYEKILIITIVLLFLSFIFFNMLRMPNMGFFDTFKSKYLNTFTVMLLSILFEAMPFVLIGAFVSSLIQIFVSESFIAKIIPKNRFMGLSAASLMGLIFPVCECAIVPIMRRLTKKGVPLHISLTFMLAVPIANPVVLLSTYYAFSGQLEIVIMRGLFGILGAITIGHFAGRMAGNVSPLKDTQYTKQVGPITQLSLEIPSKVKKIKSYVVQIIGHTAGEFYDVGKYLIIGATLSAAMQTFVPREAILSIGGGGVASIIVMMGMAFVLSLCSEADAFIARTFLGQFTTGSIVGFLIYGPMIDTKNTLMLSGVMHGKFLMKFIALITGVCFILALLVNFVGL